MKQSLGFLLTLLVTFAIGLGTALDAEAKRLGGGKSFGSKPSYSTPAKRTTTPTQPTAAQQKNADRRSALANKGGLMGLLGGLALGGLLGALFFGGAFENLNFFDILIFVGIAFLIYMFFARRKKAAMAHASPGAGASPASSGGGLDSSYERNAEPGGQRKFDTDLMFKGKPGDSAAPEAEPQGSATEAGEIPADFDREGFLQGAKAAYRQLQDAWDKGDLAEIRGLTTDQVFAELQDQVRERSGENRTELLKVEAELLEVRQAEPNVEASVLFDVLMRELDESSGDSARPYQVRELWHFIRPSNSQRPTWYLDGVQQLEE